MSTVIEKTPTPEALFDQEFSHEGDEEPSVYEIESGAQTRAHSEHIAASGGSPPKESRCGIDISALGWPLEPQNPRSDFSFINAAHRLTKTRDESERRLLAAQVHDLIRQGRYVTLARPAIRDYVRGRCAKRDTEWLAFLRKASDSWYDFAGVKVGDLDGEENG